MKKQKNQTIFEKLMKNEKIDSVGIFIQFILLIAITILAIGTIFIRQLEMALQALVVLLLFTMSYNNYTIFKRIGFTVLYTLAGIGIMAVTIIGIVYGY